MSERRDFLLPPGDVSYLDVSHRGWQAIRDGGASWLILPSYALPPGYNVSQATAALRLEAGYPDTQIDMVFFCPFLSRVDGVAIGATGGQVSVNGAFYQQWSRHRTADNPWRAGLDDIESHMLLVKHWLEREFEK